MEVLFRATTPPRPGGTIEQTEVERDEYDQRARMMARNDRSTELRRRARFDTVESDGLHSYALFRQPRTHDRASGFDTGTG